MIYRILKEHVETREGEAPASTWNATGDTYNDEAGMIMDELERLQSTEGGCYAAEAIPE